MRADLQETYGVRLPEWLAKRNRWGELLDLIDQLPSASRTKEAMLNDPVVAAQLAEASDDGPAWSPPVSEWDTSTAITAAVYDRLGDLIDTVAATAGGRSKSKHFPRPVTEVDRIKRRLRREAAEDLIALFGGRKTP